MNRRYVGLTAPQFIIAVVVVVILAGGVLYFASDVFRTKMDAQISEITKWTPENIAKDPENYLNFCERKTNDALQDLKTNEVSVAQSRARLETMKDETSKKVQVGNAVLTELKDLYQKAEANQAWPISWRNKSLEKDPAKRQIVATAREVSSQTKLMDKVETGLKSLDAQVGRIQETRAKAQEQLAEIKTSREMLKVQKITDDLTSRLVSMKGVLQATIDTASETSGIVSLDQIASVSVSTVDDAEFAKIMGGTATTKP